MAGLRVLCLDYGRVRLGVAVSDESRMLAFTQPFISTQKGNVLQKIRSVIEDNDCGEIVVGLPLSLDGTDSLMTEEVRVFVDKLRELVDIPVTLWDERLSSYAAEDALREAGVNSRRLKEKRDSESARIVLQEYLDERGK